jgi:hypothetical protein
LLERDVVIAGSAGRRGLEVPFVDGNVAAL